MVSAARVESLAAEGDAKLSSASRDAGKLNANPAMTARVRAITDRLVAQVPAFRTDTANWRWEVNVIESDQLNAFCMPGGRMAMYSGLITKLELTDAEIAAVMGHEISHALREHTREKMSQQALGGIVAAGVVAGSSARNARVNADLTNIGAALFIHLPFSRAMELEADVMGLELMARAGYDPRDAPGVWRKMARQSKGSKVDFLSTHPNHDTRIAGLEQNVPKVMPLYEATRAAAAAPAPVPAEVATSNPVKATLPVAPVPQQATMQKVGRYEHEARQVARASQCEAPSPALQSQVVQVENYKVACASGAALDVECAWGNCRVVR